MVRYPAAPRVVSAKVIVSALTPSISGMPYQFPRSATPAACHAPPRWRTLPAQWRCSATRPRCCTSHPTGARRPIGVRGKPVATRRAAPFVHGRAVQGSALVPGARRGRRSGPRGRRPRRIKDTGAAWVRGRVRQRDKQHNHPREAPHHDPAGPPVRGEPERRRLRFGGPGPASGGRGVGSHTPARASAHRATFSRSARRVGLGRPATPLGRATDPAVRAGAPSGPSSHAALPRSAEHRPPASARTGSGARSERPADRTCARRRAWSESHQRRSPLRLFSSAASYRFVCSRPQVFNV